MIARFLCLILLIVFSIPSWGSVVTQQYDSYRYDGSFITETTHNYNYGTAQKFLGERVQKPLESLSEKALDGAFWTLVGDFLATKSVTPNPAQLKNINRFQKKIPANAKENIQTHQLPNDGVAVQATSPGRVPGSKAVYEKQIDAAGKTTQYTKTTYDPQGNIVHVKDKINGGVFP